MKEKMLHMRVKISSPSTIELAEISTHKYAEKHDLQCSTDIKWPRWKFWRRAELAVVLIGPADKIDQADHDFTDLYRLAF
jgi:hypothetical protein